MQKNNYKFTFIMGYRHSHERFNNLKRVLEWINSFNDVEVILVEQDTHSKISHLNLKCEQIFIKTNMPYNRSWAFNVGLKNANSGIIVFSDTDLIMNPEKFISAIRELNTYDMVSPYHSVLDLTPQESQLPLNSLFNIQRAGRGEEDHQKINISGGISIFKTASIHKIAGWSEDFIGWGGEDDFQTIKIENFLTHKEMKATVYHLFHPRTAPDNNQYKKTLEIVNRTKLLVQTPEGVNQLKASIDNSQPKIGAMNKYDNF